jgi:uncharacterized membrane protein
MMAITKIRKNLMQAHWVFLIIAIVFGLLFISIIPPLWGLDEPSHFDRVYQIAHGEILPNTSKSDYGGNVPENLYVLGNYTIGDLVDNKTIGIIQRHEVDDPAIYRLFTSQAFSKQEHQSQATASYSPIAYVGAIFGVLIASVLHANIGHTIFLARLFSLFVYVTLVYFALLFLKDFKVRWLLFAVALFPTSIFQASVVTADNILFGLSLLFIALLIRMLKTKPEQLDKRFLYLLVVVGILLPLIKVNYIFLSFGILLLSPRLLNRIKGGKIIAYGGIVVSVLAGYIWSALAKVTSQAPTSLRPDQVQVNVSGQISSLLHQPTHFLYLLLRTLIQSSDSFVQQATVLMGWNYVAIPFVFIILISLQVMLSGLYARSELIEIRKKLLFLTVSLIVGVISIFAALYVSFTPSTSMEIQGIQGRYFIPFIVPLVLFVAALLPIKIDINKKVVPYIFGAVSLICLTVSLIYYSLAIY